ncbi:MAG: protein kinase [Polyangiales bacterium]
MAEDPLSVHARARVGRVLRGKWTLDRLIGVGGMAAVYEATHRNGSKVAIKMLHPTLMFDTGFAHRLVQEGYVANKINHPAAVKIYDDDTDEVDGAVFLVMELLQGNTLSAVRRQRKRFGEVDTLKMMIPVLECLGSAHQKGIIHRDVKPENLFVTPDNTVRVLDFGIARINDGSNVSQTRTGMVVGSPAYMAPEQALGKMNSVGPQTDVYAVGATMFAMLSGTTPHAGESTQEMIVLVATQSARSLKSVAPDVSDEVARIIDRALSYEREARFPDASAMLLELRNALTVLEGGTAPKVLPTFAADEDDEGETRVAQPAVKAPGTQTGSGAAPAQANRPNAGPLHQRQPTPPQGNPLAAKMRAPTMAPTGSPSPFGPPVAPPVAAPAPPAAPATMAMEAFPMPAQPGSSSGSFQAPRTMSMEAFAASPPPLGVDDPAHNTAPADPPMQLPPVPQTGAEVGVTSGQRAGVSTSMAWSSASSPTPEPVPAKPARPKWILPAAAAAVLVAGVGIAAVFMGSGDASTRPTPPTHVAVTPPATPTTPTVTPTPTPAVVDAGAGAAQATETVDAGAVAAPSATVDAGAALAAAVDAGAAAAPTPAAVENPAPTAVENPAPAENPTPAEAASHSRTPRTPRTPRAPRRRERSPSQANPLGY